MGCNLGGVFNIGEDTILALGNSIDITDEMVPVLSTKGRDGMTRIYYGSQGSIPPHTAGGLGRGELPQGYQIYQFVDAPRNRPLFS